MSYVPVIINILNHFGDISGYKINLQKSELLPVTCYLYSFPSDGCQMDLNT